MSAVTSFSRTASDNDASPPNGFPENMTAGSVNNSARELMKAIVDEATNNGCKVVASVAGTNTITGSMTPDITAYSAGMIVVITPANTNTGATTLNIDSLGALDVFTPDGKACKGGELVAGIPAMLVLDAGADDWIIVSPANAKLIPFAQKTDNYTIANTDCGSILYFSGASGKTFTLPGTGIDVGFWVKIRINDTTDSLSVASSGTLTWFTGAAPTAGSPRTLSPGATVFITNSGAGSWEIEGAGIS